MMQPAVVILMVSLAVGAGFVIPGYMVAAILHANNKVLWSFPISLLALFWSAFAAEVLGLPVTLGVVGAILAGQMAAAAVLLWLTRNRTHAVPISRAHDCGYAKWARWLAVSALALLVAFVTVRAMLWPLSGYDTPFRWDFLAMRILDRHNFSFYPPLTSADYHLYFYTDGIAPIVSISYWWLYAAASAHLPALTGLLTGAQLAAILAFTSRIGRHLDSPRAGLLSACILGSSTLFARGISYGQETGLMALSLAAMLSILVDVANISSRTMILAGLAAALGSLAREYGCVVPIVGVAVVLWNRKGWKNAATLAGTAALVAGPWYLRNFLKTGNPIYSNRLDGLPVNPLHAAIFDFYKSQLGVSNW